MPRLPVRVTWFAVLLLAALLALLFWRSRYFPRDPGDIKLMMKEFVDSWERERAYLHTQVLPPTSYLAISGGSDNGAFGAGVLDGWTKAGTRPQFKLVTGVSTDQGPI